MLNLFASAFALGLVFNAAPGAVFAETVRRGVRGGYRAALAVQLGSLVGDALWALLGLAGVGLLLRLDVLRLPVGAAGALYLAWLAWDAWRSAGREHAWASASTPPAARGAARAGALLSLTNPSNVAFWAAAGSALGAVGVAAPTARDHAAFLAGFMLSSLVWAVACAALVERLFRRATLGWARFTYRLCAVAFLALALASLRGLWQAHRAEAGVAAPFREAVG